MNPYKQKAIKQNNQIPAIISNCLSEIEYSFSYARAMTNTFANENMDLPYDPIENKTDLETFEKYISAMYRYKKQIEKISYEFRKNLPND